MRLAERASIRISELEDDAKYTHRWEEIVLEQYEVIRSSPAFNGKEYTRTSNDSYMSSLFLLLSCNHACARRIKNDENELRMM